MEGTGSIRDAMLDVFNTRLQEAIAEYNASCRYRPTLSTKQREEWFKERIFPAAPDKPPEPIVGSAAWKKLLDTSPVTEWEDKLPQVTQEDLERWKKEDEEKLRIRNEKEKEEVVNLQQRCRELAAKYGGKEEE